MTELTAGSVTTADLYRELIGMRGDVTKALTRIEVIDSRNSGADQVHHDLELRMRAQERFRFTLLGGALAVSAAVSAIGTWIGVIVTRH